VLISLLRAISRMKDVMDERDRAFLKDCVVVEPLHPRLAGVGVRLAILDYDAAQGIPEDDEAHFEKRRELLGQLWELCRGQGSAGAGGEEDEEESDGDYEDDFDDYEDDDDMMMPDEDVGSGVRFVSASRQFVSRPMSHNV